MTTDNDQARSNVFHEGFFVPPLLERRLWAAAADMAFVLACCFALSHSFSPLADGEHPWIWRPAALLLAGYAAVELLTGLSPGKLLTGLRVRRRSDHARRRLVRTLAARGALKFLPVALYLPTYWLGSNPDAFLVVAAVAFTVAVGEVQACYLAMVRTGATVFDLVANTVVVRHTAHGEGAAPG